MSEWIKLKTQDGHELDAYVARPTTDPAGTLVLIQEVYGVNKHIRSVADGYAKDGFLVIAPALFDRYEKNVDLIYEGTDREHAFELYPKLLSDNLRPALIDIAAAFAYAREAGKKVGVLGFCVGGLLSWLSATRGETYGFTPACAVGYYPGGIGNVATENPVCPIMLHFGSNDTHIGKDQVEAVRAAHPDVQIFEYEGTGHGFNCDMRADYDPASAALARTRSLGFLKHHLA
jgi:carboxymethylenebutenolidase